MASTSDRQTGSSGGPQLLAAVGIHRRDADRILLQDLSVAIRGGDRIAIVGPTGSGKTLLLRSLAMLDPVDAGEIRWQEQTVSGNQIPQFRCRVIYLHQRPALVEGSVEDNLRQPFSLRVHCRKTMCRDRLVELLKLQWTVT